MATDQTAEQTRQQKLFQRAAALTAIALDTLIAADAANKGLQQVQAEGWNDQDPRWDALEADADDAFKAARARLT
jgi:hypothetical protein